MTQLEVIITIVAGGVLVLAGIVVFARAVRQGWVKGAWSCSLKIIPPAERPAPAGADSAAGAPQERGTA